METTHKQETTNKRTGIYSVQGRESISESKDERKAALKVLGKGSRTHNSDAPSMPVSSASSSSPFDGKKIQTTLEDWIVREQRPSTTAANTLNQSFSGSAITNTPTAALSAAPTMPVSSASSSRPFGGRRIQTKLDSWVLVYQKQ